LVGRHALVGRGIDGAGLALGSRFGLIFLQLVGDIACAGLDRLSRLHGAGLDNFAGLGGDVGGVVGGGLGMGFGLFLLGLGAGGGAQGQETASGGGQQGFGSDRSYEFSPVKVGGIEPPTCGL
jgi:hypothetical protein